LQYANKYVNEFKYTIFNLLKIYYRAFQGSGQAKFAYGGSILGQFTLLPQLPQKNNAWFRSGQHRLENNHPAPLI